MLRRVVLLAQVCATVLILIAPSAARAEQQTLTWDLTSRFISATDAIAELHGGEIAKAGPTGLRTWVVLPDGYTPDRCWPVLYLLHGSQAPAEWAHVDELVKGLPAIVVAPGGGDSGYSDWWAGGKRKPQWERWFFEELMTKVSNDFNICPQRSAHAIGGTSMGGFGAFYLASQRPDYFGSAGSFSGIIALKSPILQIGFGLFRPIWGEPNGFYANGHDPAVIVENLRHTRLLVEQGDGTPFDANDVDPSSLATVETGTAAMGREFLASARKAKIPVTYEVHKGIHTPPNFNYSLTRMLAWNPFAPVAEKPRAWQVTTVAQRGQAWGYRYKFDKPPAQMQQLAMAGGRFRVYGAGAVTVTTPQGRAVRGKAPFAIVGGKAKTIPNREIKGSGKSVQLPVAVGLRPWHPRLGQPVQMHFRTDRKLKKGELYVAVAQQSMVGCYASAYAFINQPKKGKFVKAVLKPGVAKGHPPNRWCQGNGHISLLLAKGTSIESAKIDLLGTATFLAAKPKR